MPEYANREQRTSDYNNAGYDPKGELALTTDRTSYARLTEARLTTSLAPPNIFNDMKKKSRQQQEQPQQQTSPNKMADNNTSVGTFIDIDVNDAVELEAVPEGEYEVRVSSAEAKPGSGKGPFIMLRLDITSEPTSKSIVEVMMLPQQNDEPKQQNLRKLSIKRACDALGVDTANGIDMNDFVGQTAWAFLGAEDDPQYGRSNRVKRWITGA